MCNHKTSKGVKCLLSPKKNVCHIHEKKVIINHKQNEIKNLNNTIIKKNNTIKKIVRKANDEALILNNEIQNVNETINDLKEKINNLYEDKYELLSVINDMKEDYDKYCIIKKFEYIKSKLNKKVLKTKDNKYYNKLKSFCKNEQNEPILIEIFGKQLNYWKTYNKLKDERNRLSHNF